jgi:hypothetical protein
MAIERECAVPTELVRGSDRAERQLILRLHARFSF